MDEKISFSFLRYKMKKITFLMLYIFPSHHLEKICTLKNFGYIEFFRKKKYSGDKFFDTFSIQMIIILVHHFFPIHFQHRATLKLYSYKYYISIGKIYFIKYTLLWHSIQYDRVTSQRIYFPIEFPRLNVIFEDWLFFFKHHFI